MGLSVPETVEIAENGRFLEGLKDNMWQSRTDTLVTGVCFGHHLPVMRARIYGRLSIVSLITCFAATGATETLRQEADGGLRDSIWHNQPGIGFANKQTEYIDQAFRCAHETDRRALLFYGEARAEAVKRKSGADYEMDKDFKRRGVPIDCVGLQRHIFNLNPDVQSIGENIARFTKLGVQVQIT
jgi:hypothetical protein